MNVVRLEDLEKKAIAFIQTVYKNSKVPLYSGNSGGKDSAVLEYLLQKSGIPYTSQYGNTTIDPPGTIGHIRKYYPWTEIIQPKKSFYKLVEQHGLPTHQKRYCCQYLKEYIGAGKDTFLGIRSDEGIKRKGREYIECDARGWMKGAHKIYSIYDWHDFDIWDFIKWKEIKLAPSYAKGLKRLGCVGCPLATPTNRKNEFKIYPRFYKQIKKAIEIGMKTHPTWLISMLTKGDGELAMQWWLSRQPLNYYFRNWYDISGSVRNWKVEPKSNVFFTLKELGK